ncbi:MAG: hypothetical protein IKA47_09270 [Oscillospiraceae bacterium]|nr:hypothetical protein [Oscillospiraceae bacterium]
MKRALSLLLVLCLVTGLCGTLFVSAEGGLPSEVNITGITAPVVGALPTVEGIECNIPGVVLACSWACYEDGVMMTLLDYEIFEAAKIYRLEIWLRSDEPTFDRNAIYTVDGVQSDDVSWYSDKEVMIPVDFGTEGIITLDTLNITGIGDTGIGSVMTTANLQAEGAIITSASWSFDGEYEDGVSVFEDGRNYVLDVYADPAAGYIFSKDMVITFEGEPCDILWGRSPISMNAGFEVRYGTEGLYYVGISELPEEIAAGAAPAMDVSVQEGKAKVKDAYWVAADKTTKVTAFEDGKAYYLVVELEADDGYTFAEYTDIYAGLWDQYPTDRTEPGKTCTVYFYYSMLPVAEKVDITISGLEVGLKTSDVKVTVSGVEAEVGGLEFHDFVSGEPLTEGVFEDGKAYMIDFFLTSDSCQFTYDTEVTVNGREHYYYGTNGDSLNLEYYTSFLKKIDKVELTVAEPTVGAKPGEVKIPENANYTVEYYWQDQARWEELGSEDVFLDGHRYQVHILVEPKEGYDFSADVAVTVNGVAEEEFYLDEYQFDAVELNKSWTFADPIDKIELPAFPENITVGGTPADIENVETDKYTVEFAWFDMEEGDMTTPTFENEKVYLLQYNIIAKEGYEVTDDTKVFMGGKEYTGIWQHDYFDAFAMKAYVLGIEIVERVDLILTEPALGEKPSKVTVPENDKYEIMWPDWGENETGDIFGEIDEIEAFAAGKYIFLSANLEAKEGYAFDETTKFYINGVEVKPDVYWPLGYNGSVAFRFEPLETPPTNPATGDSFPVAVVVMLMVLSVTGAAVIGKKGFAK